MSEPLVTVITPTFNGAEFVAETVESVLAQTYERIEHVLVDDASSDGTVEVVERYGKAHPERVRVVRNAVRLGACRRRNDAIRAGRGELVAWLDQDDLWAPEKTARQVEALTEAPDAVLAYSQYEEFDHVTGATTFRSALSGADVHRRLVETGCFVASSTVMFRRDAMQRRSPALREAHPTFGDDYMLWLTLLLDGRAVLVDAPLTRLRRHAANESARLTRTNYHVLEIALLEDYLAEFPEARLLLGSEIDRALARPYLAAADHELAHGRLLRAGGFYYRAARRDARRTGASIGRHVRRAPRGIVRRLRAAAQG